MLTSTLSRRSRDLQAVLETLGGRPPVARHSNGAVFKWFAHAIQERQQLLNALAQYLRRTFGYTLQLPASPIADASIAAGHAGEPVDVLLQRLKQYDAAIEESLRSCPYLGVLEYTGAHECLFRYCDATHKYSALQVAHHVRRHEHHLVQVRERKLSDSDVVLPTEQRRIVRGLPACVLPHVRIVVGMLMLQKEGDGGMVRRDHAVGSTLRQVGNASVKYGPQALAGVAAGAAAVGIGAIIHAAVVAASTAAMVAAADPALVIGDLVISGWIEK